MDDQKKLLFGNKKVASPLQVPRRLSRFRPLVFVEGMIGQLFRDISLTVVYSLTSSLFVALVLILFKFFRVWKRKRKERIGVRFNLAPFTENYRPN